MAVVRRCASGRWQAIVRRKGFPPQSKTFPTRLDAAQWGRRVEAQIDGQTFQDPSQAQRTTIAAALDRYLEEVTPYKRSARPEARRLRLLKQDFGAYTLLTLRREVVSAYRDRRLASGTAPATVVKDLNSLAHLYEVARRDWGYPIVENPARAVRRPSVGAGRDRRLEGDEEKRLLAACDASRAPLLRPIVEFAIETAMRLGELLSLKWAEVDLVERLVKIPTSKNGYGRTVPLSSRAVELLSTMPRHITLPRVFWTWNRPDGFEATWRRAVARAGIQDLRFHDLRHEATSRLAEKVPNVIELAAITGHRNIQMLKRYYHPRPADLVRKLSNHHPGITTVR